ncbi:hypothetical protein ABFS82_10G059100 [Erythranthe guttata]
MDANRVGTHSNSKPEMCDKAGYLGGKDDDRLSKLPDDILVDIMSRMSLKEAARTSVLSSRWKHLWKYIPFLKFDADNVYKIMDHHSADELIEIEAPKYVEWVNSVIQSHKSPTLKQFKIHFHLDRRHTDAITRWIEFAFSRQAERLELNHESFVNPKRYYCFPRFHSFATSNSLKALSLKSVHVRDAAVEFILRNCPRLEELFVRYSHNFSNLEVCGSSLKLKRLDLRYSFEFESLKVCAPCLTSLKVPITEGLLLENVPMLVELSLTCHSIKGLISALACCFFQLEVLSISFFDTTTETSELDFGEMPKLKKLSVEYRKRGYEGLTRLIAALIRASPHLEEFGLTYNWLPATTKKDRQLEDAIRFPHHHLKVFELSCNYSRISTVMVDIVGGILENCVVLEKIIVDPSGGHFPIDDREKSTRRRRAKKQHEPQVPQHIELVIL